MRGERLRRDRRAGWWGSSWGQRPYRTHECGVTRSRQGEGTVRTHVIFLDGLKHGGAPDGAESGGHAPRCEGVSDVAYPSEGACGAVSSDCRARVGYLRAGSGRRAGEIARRRWIAAGPEEARAGWCDARGHP